MLKLRYLFENYELAKNALKNWEHDDEGLDEMLSMFRISSNAIYPYMDKGALCYLRLSPEVEKREENLLGELEYIEYLRQNGYPAHKPLKAKNGKTLLEISTPRGDYYASAFQGVFGTQIEDTDCSEDVIFAYGKALGFMHRLSQNYKPRTKVWSYKDVLDTINTSLVVNHAPKYIMEENKSVCGALSVLSATKENFGLVHYDFETDNVFYDDRTGSCAVIDFEDGMYNWYAADFVKAFDSLADSLMGARLESAKQIFIKGYGTERPFAKENEQLMPLIRRFCELYKYSRLIRVIDETFPNEIDWMTALKLKLKKDISEYERSVYRRKREEAML
ncbi:MAG: phosphotransferase [Eubacteriales bacterium]|nr:phosphotransferase [Eubacteriales bacterium]MDD3883091.1 phosphotransferase [Eubacteriales bacterium]MDD4512616.1 phosphotransferase [Eubacteriales bacterium]